MDAAQSAGKLPLRVHDLQVDLLSLSAHKFYGPKGVGALFVRRTGDFNLSPLLFGGGQERGLRPGTLATHQVVGLGAALALAESLRESEWARMEALSAQLWAQLDTIPGAALNCTAQSRAPHYLNVRFEGVEGEALLLALRDLCVSSGSACTSASVEPSHVLTALGLPRDFAHSSIRFSLGRGTTAEHIETAAARVAAAVDTLRSANPSASVRRPAPAHPTRG